VVLSIPYFGKLRQYIQECCFLFGFRHQNVSLCWLFPVCFLQTRIHLVAFNGGVKKNLFIILLRSLPALCNNAGMKKYTESEVVQHLRAKVSLIGLTKTAALLDVSTTWVSATLGGAAVTAKVANGLGFEKLPTAFVRIK
jgi:hypothetical protein